MDTTTIPKGEGTDWFRLREVHRSMMKRCYNANHHTFAKYGARGIKVCEEWHDFENFYGWAMTHGYRKGLTIDRINNNAGYNPGNCRWISPRAQANNRTTARRYTIDGHTKTLSQWCSHFGIPDYVVVHRINDYGWSVEDAFKTPRGEKRPSRKREKRRGARDMGYA